MPSTDGQWGFKKETTVGTAVTVDRFQEYQSESLEFTHGRVDSEPLRSGQHGQRDDRWTPFAQSAAGTITFDVLTKNFAFFLEHMLGSVATSGPADSVYTHTGTVGSLWTKAFTCQVNRPLYTTGNQAFTLAGTKIKTWKLSNSLDGNLVGEFEVDAMSYSTATALASASYPSSMDNFSFAGGAVTIGGSGFDVTEFSVSMDNKLKTDERRYLGNTRKEAVVAGQRRPEFALKGDFDGLTQFNRVASATRAGALASVVATWTGPILAGVSAYPQVIVTLGAARFDAAAFDNPGGLEPIEMELTGVGLDPTAGGGGVSIVVKTVESTP